MTQLINPHSRGLAVTVPDVSTTQGNSREATTARIARNVAALFGVAVPDAPHPGAPWLCDYNDVTNVDIGSGSPPGWGALDRGRRPDGREDSGVVSPATLSQFGPDSKAALVLHGANALLRDVFETMGEVVRMTSLCDDGYPLADPSRLSIWASLQLDAFEAQPLLTVAAYRARAIQRAVTANWRPVVDTPPRLPPQEAKRTPEFQMAGAEKDVPSRPVETELNVVDGVMRVVDPVTEGDGEMSNQLLIEETVGRMLSHITNGLADASYARIAAGPDGNRRLDVVVNRASVLGAFFDANLRVYNEIEPLVQDKVPTRLASGTSASVRVPFDPESLPHWLRLLPRIPSAFELMHARPVVRLATIRALGGLLRALRSSSLTMPDEILQECRARALALAEVSEAVLGAEHEESVIRRIYYHELLWPAVRIGRAAPADHPRGAQAVAQAVVDDCSDLFGRMDTFPAGEWLPVMDQVSGTLSIAIRNLQRSDPKRAKGLADQQFTRWLESFQRLGVDVMKDDLDHLLRRCDGLATPLHDWVAVATRGDRPLEVRIRGIEVGHRVTLPLRKRLAEIRRHDRPYRLTLQVLGRALSDILQEDLEHEVATTYAAYLLEIEDQLASTSRCRQLLSVVFDDPGTQPLASQFGTSDAITMLSLADVALRNQELSPHEANADRTRDALRVAQFIMSRADETVASDLSERLLSLEQRWSRATA
ncbi:hypothetical protein MWU75_07495 [Ornithinimicrobium sp. F0845]|uniref:hypothetical protein n=1 Tax=Ornithinimicrobium sp. F0845 TaxID=2926412 RepID=UPI001FF64970|nr:hypothetical protein [Ornithinimicrobium sp. F0845]MCK0111978.1 hypothetical protein [Ornithinimicrobium sp. F0845]